MIGETRYTQSGDITIAYQVTGDGPVDLLVIPGIVSHVEFMHELPGYTRFLTELGSVARVITFDKRGNGLSDRVHDAPSLEERMDDARAVLAAVGSAGAVVLGVSEGAPLAIFFSVSYPEKAKALVLFGGFARLLRLRGYSAGLDAEAFEGLVETTVSGWGTGVPLLTLFGLSGNDDTELRTRAARCERLSATPTMLRRLWTMNSSIDVRDALAQVRVPTTVLHRKSDGIVPIRSARYLAKNIPGARLVELEGQGHFPFVGDTSATVREVIDALGVPRGSGVVSRPQASAPSHSSVAFSPTLSAPRSLEEGLARLMEDDVDRPTDMGRFAIERLLGRGAMGSIYLAVDRDLSRRVAIKVLRSTHVEAMRRFRHEAQAVARLSHPNVVSIHELGLDAEVPYLVMEYVPGGTLARLLEQEIPVWRATRIVHGVARGLGAAHARGIVHRDVKPQNLLLVEPEGEVAKVADFGLAKLAGAAEALTSEGTVLGTVGYLSPEQARGESVDARSDLFSLAVTWFRLLTGRKPFEGTPAEVFSASSLRAMPDPRGLRPSIPRSVAELLQRLGALLPGDRPADGHQAADELGALLASEHL